MCARCVVHTSISSHFKKQDKVVSGAFFYMLELTVTKKVTPPHDVCACVSDYSICTFLIQWSDKERIFILTAREWRWPSLNFSFFGRCAAIFSHCKTGNWIEIHICVRKFVLGSDVDRLKCHRPIFITAAANITQKVHCTSPKTKSGARVANHKTKINKFYF